jgi:thiamine biosynthesis lipoprotein
MDGYAQGTTYQVTLVSDSVVDYSDEINHIFNVIDQSMSTWIDTSLISRINKGDTSVVVDEHFINVFQKSKTVSTRTDGAFDFTVGPLARAWGFGPDGKVEHIDSTIVDSLRQLVGYQKVELVKGRIRKQNPNIHFDFNAIAQGYTVDVIYDYLYEKGYRDFLIEVGGELRASGRNASGEIWRIGIDKPSEKIQTERFIAIIQLDNRALATSGNYRKFYIDEQTGMKYVHTIDPKTGYPVQSNLLSVSVLAKDATTADAYATAMMVKGLEESKVLLKNMSDELEAMLIYSDDSGKWKTYTTEGFESAIQ